MVRPLPHNCHQRIFTASTTHISTHILLTNCHVLLVGIYNATLHDQCGVINCVMLSLQQLNDIKLVYYVTMATVMFRFPVDIVVPCLSILSPLRLRGNQALL